MYSTSILLNKNIWFVKKFINKEQFLFLKLDDVLEEDFSEEGDD